MQCIAVLLLEAAYQGRHTEKHNAHITTDIRKLMNWLHAMENNDHVASRAYGVVRKILHNVAPVLAPKAKELLNKDSVDHESARTQESRRFASPCKQQSGPGWAQGELFDGTTPITGHQYYPPQQTTSQHHDYASTSALDHSAYADFSTGHSMGQYHMPSTFGNPFLNNWDQGPPVVDMHNLWYTPNFNNNYPEDLSDMDLLGMNMDPQQSQYVQETPLAYNQQRQ